MNDKIYYISQYDNKVHNIYDTEHLLIDKKRDQNNICDAYIGKNCGTDGFRVDEEVTLYTIHEIVKFFK